MAYNPGVTAHGGEYIMRGAEIASQAMAKGISDRVNDHKMTEKETTLLTGKASAYHDAGVISTDDYRKFMQGNINAKREIMSMADTHLLMQQQSGQQAYQGAQTAHLNAVTAGIPAQTAHTEAITSGIQQTNAATQAQIDAAQRNQSNLDAWTKHVGGGAAPAASAPAPAPAPPSAAATIPMNLMNPIAPPVTMKQLYGYY